MNVPSKTVLLEDPLYKTAGVKVFMKRDDLIHPDISGNKWRKLKHNVEKFKQGKYERLLTFGGAFSNHIAATAALGAELEIQTIGIIRGDELTVDSNETLNKASSQGMELVFTSREEYNLRDEKYYHEELRRRHGHIWIVPEGGANFYGALGCQEILTEEASEYDFAYCPMGTGTTVSGLLLGSKTTRVVGVSALKGGEFLKDSIVQRLLEFGFDEEILEGYLERLALATDFHFGGYAKHSDNLLSFMNEFYKSHGIPLDKVYTAKMMYALNEHIQAGEIPEGSTVLVIHTGGLQGNKSVSSELLFD